jgi:hypothetical protein
MNFAQSAAVALSLTAAFMLAGCGAKSPDNADIKDAVNSSLKAEIVEAGKPLPVGKVFAWDAGKNENQWGTAKVAGINNKGCYDLDVRVVHTGSTARWTLNSRSDYETGTIHLCPNAQP